MGRILYDAIFVADPRFPGGTSTALAAELAAACEAGISHALFPVKGPALRRCWPYHEQIRALRDSGDLHFIEPGQPASTEFLIIHHPTLLEELLVEPPDIDPEHVILILHHPMRDGNGREEYDLPRIIANINLLFGKPPRLAPVGPSVREQLIATPALSQLLLEDDWFNLIDVGRWKVRQPQEIPDRIRVGRHSRPHPPKWPRTADHAFAIWPTSQRYDVRMLGGGDFIERRYGKVPANWTIIPFGQADVGEFLNDLDFYVYYHSDEWVEAFGRNILEALVTGLVTILPRNFRPLFGQAAIYADPENVADQIEQFAADPARYQMQSQRARKIAEDRFGLKNFLPRLENLSPEWAIRRKAAQVPFHAPPRRPKRFLLVSSNGVGLGHLTRLLALAETFRDDVQSVFFTLSQGFGLVEDAGFPVEYRPFHKVSGADNSRWNSAFCEELTDAIAFYSPDLLIFDGNVPYQGLLDALGRFPAMKSVWMRRGFWREDSKDALERHHIFDAVIEPGDVASLLDTGPTAREARDQAHAVGPVIRKTRQRILSRDEARSALGLPDEGTYVVMSLGSGSNFDLTGLRRAIVSVFSRRPDDTLVELTSPIQAAPSEDDGTKKLSVYPLFPYLSAFDAMIATCGYNTFHEALASGIPALWVPNEAPEMDQQLLRARYAELAGASLVLRRVEQTGVHGKIEALCSADKQARMRRRALEIARDTGAKEAVEFIMDYAYLRKPLPSR